MSDSSFAAAHRKFCEAGAEIFAKREQEPVFDWTVFYNSSHLKLRWDVSGKSASEMEHIAEKMAEIFGRKPKFRR